MKLYYITTILFIISLVFMIIGLIMKSKKIRKVGFGIMIFIAVFWIAFFVWCMYDMAEEEKRHFGNENNSNTTLEDKINNDEFYEDCEIFVNYKVIKISDIEKM